MSGKTRILRVDSSMRQDGSNTRAASDKLMNRLDGEVVVRDLAVEPIPFVDQQWIGANFTPDEERTAAQREALAFSDSLIEELKAADILVLGVPTYNFNIPAAFKAWIDLIARARLTFNYTKNGPVGLLEGKKAFVVNASGGVVLGSEQDFMSPYMRKVLGFVGITDVTFIATGKDVDLDAVISQVIVGAEKAA